MCVKGVELKAYNQAGEIIYEQFLPTYRWYEDLHPAINSNAARIRLGIVRIEGCLYNKYDTLIVEWAAHYYADGSLMQMDEWHFGESVKTTRYESEAVKHGQTALVFEEGTSMYPELTGKVAIISGAGGALGQAVARRLHEEGVRLALADRSVEATDALLQSLGTDDSGGLALVADLTQPDAVQQAVDSVAAHFGGLDIVVNVAGGFVFTGPTLDANLADVAAQWESMAAINVKTGLLLSLAGAKHMAAQGRGGRVIVVGARPALSGAANLSAYSASKAALVNLTESLADEWREHDITLNAILPSTIDTPANRKSMPDADFTRWVTPDSLAAVIAFLASDAARDVSGAALPVYGKS